MAIQSGFEGEVEVIHDAQTLQLTVQSPHVHGAPVGLDFQGNDRFYLQLKHLQAGDGVAVVAWTESGQVTGIQQGTDHPLLLLEVLRQPFAQVVHG